MRRLLLLVVIAALGCKGDPRGTCVNEYVDHYTYSTHCDSRNICTTDSNPVYECDVWTKVSNDSVLVTTKVGHDRRVVHVGAEGYR